MDQNIFWTKNFVTKILVTRKIFVLKKKLGKTVLGKFTSNGFFGPKNLPLTIDKLFIEVL